MEKKRKEKDTRVSFHVNHVDKEDERRLAI